jgi:hypothetical protein
LTAYASTIYNRIDLSRILRTPKTAHKSKKQRRYFLERAVLSFKKKLSKPVTFGDILLILIVLAFMMWLFWPHRVIAETSPPKPQHYEPHTAVSTPDIPKAEEIPVPGPTPAPAPVQASKPTPAPVSSGSHEDWMAAAGIDPSDYGYVDYIISRESGWNPNAYNPSGAEGLPQALPYSKTGCAHGDPICQLVWANSYAQAKGGWYASYQFWINHHWW